MERAGDALLGDGRRGGRRADSPADALRAGPRAFFAFLDSDRAAWAVLFDETLPAGGEIAERVADYRERLLALVAASIIAQLPARAADGARSRSRRSRPRCWAPPRRSRAGGCAPRRSPPRTPPSC